ncbi:MAG: phosphate ABC transporter substrate-binding protein PstS [Actinomycetota bacterium]|nr:phosphate ABC transporter substrate-binding protein PstS [Actinomycetota bacterium]
MTCTTLRRRVAPAAVICAASLGFAACGAANEAAAPEGGDERLSGSIAGAGASSQAAAMEAWIAGFTNQHPDVTINYDPIGSGGGREQFINGGTVFAGTDAALDEQELATAQKRCGGDVVEIPLYISPIAIIYNLEGVDQLQLSPVTIAGIFAQQITSWNDPAIAADNPGVTLPNLPITPVNRSDESGTTENFTDYLSATAPRVWTFEVSGNWPIPGGEAAQGTSGVVGAVGAGNGTIGYADASQVGDLGVVSVGVGGEFVQPTPEAAAAVLGASERVEGGGQYVFAYDLARDTTASGTYPIVLVSYEVACANYEDQQIGDLVGAFLNYTASQEGQQAAAEAAGSAPISDSLREQIRPAIDAIAATG